MPTLMIDVCDLETTKARMLAALEGAEPQMNILSFPSEEQLFTVLTAQRWTLLRALAGAGPVGVRELARRVERDVKGVHGDAQALVKAGVVDKLPTGNALSLRCHASGTGPQGSGLTQRWYHTSLTQDNTIAEATDDMEMTGKIIQVLPEKNGTSARGPWRKQEYVIELPGDYPKQVCFMLWGDRIDQFGIREGQDLTVSFDLESREFNGRWYTDVKAWRVAPAGSSEPGSGLQDEPPAYDEEPPF